MIPDNPYLEEFFANSREMRDRIIREGLLTKVEDKLKIEKEHRGVRMEGSWHNGVFIPLVQREIGLKKREKLEGLIELAVHADLYNPDLPISPFGVIVKENPDQLVYAVKDFGLDMGHIDDQTFDAIPSIPSTLDYLITRGYGIRKALQRPFEAILERRATDPKFRADNSAEVNYRALLETFRECGENLWRILFVVDDQKNWAIVDLDCDVLANYREIRVGVDERVGGFSRLKPIAERIYKECNVGAR